MGFPETANAQHIADLRAIIAECPSKMKFDFGEIDVGVGIIQLGSVVNNLGMIPEGSITVLGVTTDLGKVQLIPQKSTAFLKVFGASDYALYSVQSFQQDSVSFVAVLSLNASAPTGRKFV